MLERESVAGDPQKKLLEDCTNEAIQADRPPRPGLATRQSERTTPTAPKSIREGVTLLLPLASLS